MIELLDLQLKMYNARWHGGKGDLQLMEFMKIAERECVDLEQVNELLEQLYIPPYSKETLKHGGERKGAGRPSLGTTKKVSITLPDEVWEQIQEAKGERSMSSFLRDVIINGNWFDFPLFQGGQMAGGQPPHCVDTCKSYNFHEAKC